MGAESKCTVQYAGQRSEGKALLETDHLIFRGTFRLNIPRKSITTLDADAGTLRVTFPGGTAVFELGPSAAKWAEKIRNPTSTAEIGQIYISAEDGKVLERDLHTNRVD